MRNYTEPIIIILKRVFQNIVLKGKKSLPKALGKAICGIFVLFSFSHLYWKKQHKAEKKKNAIEFNQQVNLYLRPNILKLEKLMKKGSLHEFSRVGSASTAVLSFFRKSTQLQIKALIEEICVFYEQMAIAIDGDVYDEQLVFESQSRSFISFYNWVRTYIIEKRINADEELLFKNLEIVARRWKNINRENESEVLYVPASAIY